MDITLGDHSYHSNINCPWEIKITIGKWSSIADHLDVISAMHTSCSHHEPNAVTTCRWLCPSIEGHGKVIIGNDVWIGYRTTIVNPVVIGDGAIVGACSVIRKDVPPYSVVFGNPATVVKKRFTDEQIEALLKIKWWDWPDELVFSRVEDFKNIATFVEKYNRREA